MSCLYHLFPNYKKLNSLDEYLTLFNESYKAYTLDPIIMYITCIYIGYPISFYYINTE